MTTGQIIVLIILVLIQGGIIVSYHLKMINRGIEDDKVIFGLLILGLLTTIIISYKIELTKLEKELRCPEYEKVENVYKLK